MHGASRCVCGARLVSRRTLATAADIAPPSAAFAPPPGARGKASTLPGRDRTRLLVATVLSRPPVLLPALSDFERSYYAYQRGIHHALSGHFDPSWYFRSGSAAEGAFKELDAREQRGEDPPMPSRDGDDGATTDEAVDYGRDRDLKSPRRQLDRTLYLLVRKDRKQHAWQFPQGEVLSADPSLVAAADRQLAASCGSDMDSWAIGKLPAGTLSYAQKSKSADGTTVFFMPAHILRGQAAPQKDAGVVEHAWLTKEEIQERVDPNYWAAVGGLLNTL